MSDTGSSSSSALRGWLNRLRTLLNLRPASIRTDLEEVLAEDKTGGAAFTPVERTMLQNILALEELRIGDIMVPRADIVAVQKDIQIGELLRVFATAAHSRLVVYDDTLDDPTGLVHIRDVVAYLTARALVNSEVTSKPTSALAADLDPRNVNLNELLAATQLVRRILFAPPSMPAIDLLVKMQATRVHLALVIDEYGGTDGLVSMEDIVEQIVGNIEDEHDDDEVARIVLQPDGSFIADARASLDEAKEKIGAEFAANEAAEEVDTLGGLLVLLAGRLPVRGEIIPGPGEFEIEVLDADPRRAKRLRISRKPASLLNQEPRSRNEKPAPALAAAPQEPMVRARSADDSSS
jgi:CBS domain containing-hemolysin-like protein